MRVWSRQLFIVVIEMGKKYTNTKIIATLTRIQLVQPFSIQFSSQLYIHKRIEHF